MAPINDVLVRVRTWGEWRVTECTQIRRSCKNLKASVRFPLQRRGNKNETNGVVIDESPLRRSSPTFYEFHGLFEPVGVGVAVVEDVGAERDPLGQDGLGLPRRVVDVVYRVQHRLHRLKGFSIRLSFNELQGDTDLDLREFPLAGGPLL